MNLTAGIAQSPTKVLADEAAAAGDQDPEIKFSLVFCSHAGQSQAFAATVINFWTLYQVAISRSASSDPCSSKLFGVGIPRNADHVIEVSPHRS